MGARIQNSFQEIERDDLFPLFECVHGFTHLVPKLLDLIAFGLRRFVGFGFLELDDFVFGNRFAVFLISLVLLGRRCLFSFSGARL